MSDMTVQEFAEKLVKDKAFRKEVVKNCGDFNPPEGDENGMGIWINAGAGKMGYDFDDAELQESIKAQMDKLSGFKKIAFVGSLINNARKVRKSLGVTK